MFLGNRLILLLWFTTFWGGASLLTKSPQRANTEQVRPDILSVDARTYNTLRTLHLILENRLLWRTLIWNIGRFKSFYKPIFFYPMLFQWTPYQSNVGVPVLLGPDSIK